MVNNPNEPAELLARIDNYLKAEQEAGGRGRTYHPHHPATLLSEAYAVIVHLKARSDEAIRLMNEWDKPNAATRQAMLEARTGQVERFDSVEGLVADLNAPDEP